jgi:hypothetical protein
MGASLRSSVSYLALLAGLALGSSSAAALPTKEVLWHFKAPPSDRQYPMTALIIDKRACYTARRAPERSHDDSRVSQKGTADVHSKGA